MQISCSLFPILSLTSAVPVGDEELEVVAEVRQGLAARWRAGEVTGHGGREPGQGVRGQWAGPGAAPSRGLLHQKGLLVSPRASLVLNELENTIVIFSLPEHRIQL